MFSVIFYTIFAEVIIVLLICQIKIWREPFVSMTCPFCDGKVEGKEGAPRCRTCGTLFKKVPAGTVYYGEPSEFCKEMMEKEQEKTELITFEKLDEERSKMFKLITGKDKESAEKDEE